GVTPAVVACIVTGWPAVAAPMLIVTTIVSLGGIGSGFGTAARTSSTTPFWNSATGRNTSPALASGCRSVRAGEAAPHEFWHHTRPPCAGTHPLMDIWWPPAMALWGAPLSTPVDS